MPSTTLGRARRLHHLAHTEPDRVDLAELTALLETEVPPSAHRLVVATVSELASHRDGTRTIIAEEVERLLRAEVTSDALALRCLRALANEDPHAVVGLADAVAARFAVDSVEVRRAATACAAELAVARPRAFVDTVPVLATLLEDPDETVRQGAVFVLAKVAHEYPEEVMPAAPQLLTDLTGRAIPFQTCALSALGAVVSSYPAVGADSTATFADLATSSAEQVRTNAVGLLADVAQTDPSAVEPHVPILRDALEMEDLTARNAATALANVGEGAADAIPDLLEVLDHPDAVVRRNVARALGEIGATIAMTHLRELSESDPDEQVRAVACWALEQC